MYQGENQAEANAKTGPERAVQGPLLGIYAKSCSTPDSKGNFSDPESGHIHDLLDHDTGELLKVRQRSNLELELVRDPADVRLERFALQSAARRIIPEFRVKNCLRVPQAHRKVIDVTHSIQRASANYSGLQTCASVWVCPVCAAKVSERRRVELAQAIEYWETVKGGTVLLRSLTHPHTAGDALADLLKAEQKAMGYMRQGRPAAELSNVFRIVGYVRAWEVTHGRHAFGNGFHPHFHELLFLESRMTEASVGYLQERSAALWQAACVKAGLDQPDPVRGCRIDGAGKAAAYVAKMGLEESGWSLAHEVTKGHTKRAADGKGETPFDLLRAAAFDRDRHAQALFREFAFAFKGKRQLVWSKGLRELLALGVQLSDEEVAASIEDDAYILGSIDLDQWRLIVKHDLRGTVLELARLGSWEPVQRLLHSLQGGIS